jgi:hypothetical protein
VESVEKGVRLSHSYHITATTANFLFSNVKNKKIENRVTSGQLGPKWETALFCSLFEAGGAGAEPPQTLHGKHTLAEPVLP